LITLGEPLAKALFISPVVAFSKSQFIAFAEAKLITFVVTGTMSKVVGDKATEEENPK
jgi:hypothetical protein